MKGIRRPHRGRGADLERSGLMPKRNLSQNFLEDRAILERMAAIVNKSLQDHAALPIVVEIGPGEGALTRHLLPFVSVHAVDKDERSVALLRKTLLRDNTAPSKTSDAAHDPQLTVPSPGIAPRLLVTQGDIRELDLRDLVHAAHGGSHSLMVGAAAKPMVVGNLPYAISSDILLWACQAAPLMHSCHFLLQKEVVDRLIAKPGTKDYGRIGIFVSLHFDIEVHFDVPPEAFYPQPKVTSTFFSLRPKDACRLDQGGLALLERLTAALFSQRRKKLRNALSFACTQLSLGAGAYETLAKALSTYTLTLDDRPERLPPEALVDLTIALRGSEQESLSSDTP